MGTNYYAVDKEKNKIHIGKSSYGWYFAMRVYPYNNINTFKDWLKYLTSEDKIIENEYGEVLSLENLIMIIVNRSFPVSKSGNPTEEYLKQNYAEVGANNLLRHDMSLDDYCTGHGEGTWSYFNVEFS